MLLRPAVHTVEVNLSNFRVLNSVHPKHLWFSLNGRLLATTHPQINQGSAVYSVLLRLRQSKEERNSS
jgi:hypothetical protein